MKIPKLAFAMGCIDDDLMVAAEEYKPIPQANVIFHWKRFAAIAACLCVLIAGAVLMSVPEDSGTPVLLWGADFQAVDYFKYNLGNDGAHTSKIIAESELPYSMQKSFSDERIAMEEAGIIPLMSDYPKYSCIARYDEDNNISSITFSWYRRGNDYSDLRIVAGCQKIQRVQECLSIDIDADGNIVTPAVTVVERDGVEIVTTGSAGKEKTITFQNNTVWYQITGSWNDSYEAVAELLDWIWEHPIDFKLFAVDEGSTVTFSSLDKYPTAFSGELPAFDSLGYIRGEHYLKLKNGVPYVFEGYFYKGIDSEIVESGDIPSEGDWIEIQWYIESDPDYDDLQGCSGTLTDLSQQQVYNIISEKGKISFLHNSHLVKVYCNEADEVWDLLKSLNG